MAIRLPSAVKSRLQSFLPTLSFGLARQRTEALLSGVAAVVLGIRGCGCSPSVLNEAKGAARWVNANEDFVLFDAGANLGSWIVAVCKYLPKSSLAGGWPTLCGTCDIHTKLAFCPGVSRHGSVYVTGEHRRGKR